MEHTPGPWTTGHDGHGGMYLYGKGDQQVGFVSSGPDQKSNALLLAAAPEMFAFLCKLTERTWHRGMLTLDAEEMCEIGRIVKKVVVGDQE